MGLAYDRARTARGHRRSRSRGGLYAAGARRRVRHARRSAHAHDLQRWPRHARRRWSPAAHALGYEYIAITDHSERRGRVANAGARRASRGSARRSTRCAERFPRDDDPARHRGRHPAGRPARFRGRDPRTVRHRAGVAPRSRAARRRRLTERSLAAIRHPLVNVIMPSGQPAGRPSAGYDLDFDALYAAAVETGTALEDRRRAKPHGPRRRAGARAAVAAGVTLSIDSDCHRVRGAGPADGASASARPDAAGSSPPRAEYPSAGRSPRVHRGQAPRRPR